MSTSVANLSFHSLASRSTRSELEFAVLTPVGLSPDRPVPLIMHLHGAMSSARSLVMARDAYERSWAAGELPPSIVACASTPTLDGFYIDYPGAAGWETLVAQELPAYLASIYPLSGLKAALGFSMGGYGALKLALRRAPAFCVVSALCPTVFPAERAIDVPDRNRPAVLDDLHEAMVKAGYEANSVPVLLRNRGDALKAAGTDFFIDCGEADEFMLHHGAAYLHHLMRELGVRHVFRSVPEAGHAALMEDRQGAAVAFIAAALRKRLKPLHAPA